MSVCVYFIGAVILIATTKTLIDSERASKSKCGCQLFGTFSQNFWSHLGPGEKCRKYFGFFFAVFFTFLTNFGTLITNMYLLLIFDFRFGFWWVVKSSKKRGFWINLVFIIYKAFPLNFIRWKRKWTWFYDPSFG